MKSRSGKNTATAKSSVIINCENSTINTNSSDRQLQNLKKIIKLTDKPNSIQSANRYNNYPIFQKTKDNNRLIKMIGAKKDFLSLKETELKSLSPHKESSSTKAFASYPKLISLEKLSLSKKLASVNNLFKSNHHTLKNFNLAEDLEINYKILSENNETKGKTWFENLISIQEYKKNEKNLESDMKFCNDIIRDIILRLKTSGKENESIIIDKLWRFILEVFDSYIEIIKENIKQADIATKNTIKAQDEILIIKLGCQKKVEKLEKEIERVKLDYILAKNPRKIVEDNKIQNSIPRIENIKKMIDKIYELTVNENHSSDIGKIHKSKEIDSKLLKKHIRYRKKSVQHIEVEEKIKKSMSFSDLDMVIK